MRKLALYLSIIFSVLAVVCAVVYFSFCFASLAKKASSLKNSAVQRIKSAIAEC